MIIKILHSCLMPKIGHELNSWPTVNTGISYRKIGLHNFDVATMTQLVATSHYQGYHNRLTVQPGLCMVMCYHHTSADQRKTRFNANRQSPSWHWTPYYYYYCIFTSPSTFSSHYNECRDFSVAPVDMKWWVSRQLHLTTYLADVLIRCSRRTSRNVGNTS